MEIRQKPPLKEITYHNYFEMLSDMAKYVKETGNGIGSLGFDSDKNIYLRFCDYSVSIIWQIKAEDLKKSLKECKFLGLLDCDVSEYETIAGRVKIKSILNEGKFPIRNE